ncbi:GntR family transcriptional regulator [Brucellaceae bacterium D45D]
MTPKPADDMSMSEETDVTNLILHDIQSGVLAADSWLKQVDLEQRYNRGRNQIRRALDRLAQKRLVKHVPNRGYHVYAPDGAQAEEIAEIRVILETAIADKIVANATARDIEELRNLAKNFDHLAMNGTALQLYEINLSFHKLLVTLGGNQELTTLVSEIRQRTSSAPVSQWKTKARIEISASEHHQMVDAIVKGDAQQLRQLITNHIRQP